MLIRRAKKALKVSTSKDEKETESGRKKLGKLEAAYANVWKDTHGGMPVAQMDMAVKDALKGLVKHCFISVRGSLMCGSRDRALLFRQQGHPNHNFV